MSYPLNDLSCLLPQPYISRSYRLKIQWAGRWNAAMESSTPTVRWSEQRRRHDPTGTQASNLAAQKSMARWRPQFPSSGATWITTRRQSDTRTAYQIPHLIHSSQKKTQISTAQSPYKTIGSKFCALFEDSSLISFSDQVPDQWIRKIRSTANNYWGVEQRLQCISLLIL